MKGRIRIWAMLCFGLAAGLVLSATNQAGAQCSGGYSYGGWYNPGGSAYYTPAPSIPQAEQPKASPSGPVAQSNSQTYQSFSAEPSPAPSPTYSVPSYPTYGGNYGFYYGGPAYYGGYGYSSGWRSLDNAGDHGVSPNYP